MLGYDCNLSCCSNLLKKDSERIAVVWFQLDVYSSCTTILLVKTPSRMWYYSIDTNRDRKRVCLEVLRDYVSKQSVHLFILMYLFSYITGIIQIGASCLFSVCYCSENSLCSLWILSKLNLIRSEFDTTMTSIRRQDPKFGFWIFQSKKREQLKICAPHSTRSMMTEPNIFPSVSLYQIR